MALKLYGLPATTCTTRAMTSLVEKGVEFELVPVNLLVGEHKQPAHLARHPFGLVPALEDGDLCLFESRAITTYVAEKYKNTGTDLLRHENLQEAALVKVWCEVESQHYDPVIFQIVNQYVFAPFHGRQADQKVIDENLEKLGKVLDVYEARLSKTQYLAGDFFSLADLHHLSYTYYLMTMTPFTSLINDRPHVKAWWERISSRPAFKKVAEGIKFN